MLQKLEKRVRISSNWLERMRNSCRTYALESVYFSVDHYRGSVYKLNLKGEYNEKIFDSNGGGRCYYGSGC